MSPRGELAAMGRALGGLRWVQGPGGNVSVKGDDGQLWIKASGKLLTEVATDGGHAKVPLDLVLRALDGDSSADGEVFARAPRPSLETYFHALGPKVVAHTHALGALLYACSDAPTRREPFDGVVEIPYVRPGRGIATAVRDVLAGEWAERLVVLRSHGVIAYAPTAARAIALTERFDDQCRARFGEVGPFDVTPYIADEELSFDGGVAREVPRRALAIGAPPRYLFPDAPVCASAVPVQKLGDLRSVAHKASMALGRACVVVDRTNRRLAVAKSSAQLRQTCEVLAAHDWLEDQLRSRGCASYLDVDEPAAILNMPSEQYRIKLAENEEDASDQEH